MLTAASALVYTIFSTVGLDRYIGYFLPMPVVMACVRRDIGAGLKTVLSTTLLLVALQGPFKALTYLFNHGIISFVLGACWSQHLPWVVSIPLGALARVAGSLSYLLLSSWMFNENLLQLILNNMLQLLDQIAASVGAASGPPFQVCYGSLAERMVASPSEQGYFLLLLLRSLWLPWLSQSWPSTR